MSEAPRQFVIKRVPICPGCLVAMHRNGKPTPPNQAGVVYYRCPQCKTTAKGRTSIVGDTIPTIGNHPPT